MRKMISLYRRLCASLRPGGWYVETDYMAPDSHYEAQCFADYERLKREQGLGEGFYHFDRPCTVEHQLSMLRTAGFADAQECWRCGGTSVCWRGGKLGLCHGSAYGIYLLSKYILTWERKDCDGQSITGRSGRAGGQLYTPLLLDQRKQA